METILLYLFIYLNDINIFRYEEEAVKNLTTHTTEIIIVFHMLRTNFSNSDQINNINATIFHRLQLYQ